MHKLEETKYGYRVTFEGFMSPEDMGKLLTDVKAKVRPRDDFAVFVDFRRAPAFSAETQEVLKDVIGAFKERGMGRQVVVLNSAIATLQAKRLSKETGVIEFCRYLDASTDPEWEQVAMDWLIKGVDPYKDES